MILNFPALVIGEKSWKAGPECDLKAQNPNKKSPKWILFQNISPFLSHSPDLKAGLGGLNCPGWQYDLSEEFWRPQKLGWGLRFWIRQRRITGNFAPLLTTPGRLVHTREIYLERTGGSERVYKGWHGCSSTYKQEWARAQPHLLACLQRALDSTL